MSKSKTLTLDEAEKLLINNSSTLIQKKIEHEMVNQELRVGYAALYPKLSANWNDQKRGDSAWRQSYSLDMDATLFAGGQEYSSIATLRHRQASSEYSVLDTEDQLRIKLIHSYVNAAVVFEKIGILNKTISTIDERFKEQTRRFRLGQVREPDLLQTEMEFLRLSRELELQTLTLHALKSEIRRMLNLNTEDDFELSSVNDLPNQLKLFLKPRKEFLVKSLESDVSALQYETKSTLRSHLPTLSAFASVGKSESVISASDVQGSEFLTGIRAKWTFFDGFELPASLKISKAKQRILEEKVFELKRDRERSIEVRAKEQASLARRFDSVKKAKVMAQKAVVVQQRDYRRGIVTELEVLSSLQNHLQLQNEEVDILSQLVLLKAKGLELGVE